MKLKTGKKETVTSKKLGVSSLSHPNFRQPINSNLLFKILAVLMFLMMILVHKKGTVCLNTIDFYKSYSYNGLKSKLKPDNYYCYF